MIKNNLRKSGFRVLAVFCISTFLSSCIIGYQDFPEEMVGKRPSSKPYHTLYYKINEFPVIDTGGQSALHSVFRNKSPFQNTDVVTKMPEKGVYCLVDPKWKPFGIAALVFGYISFSTLTMLPAWSLQEGFIIDYHLFIDGERQRTFEYEITRKGALWAGLLPLIWINFFTYSEAQAFEATAYRFFEDAKPIFAKLKR